MAKKAQLKGLNAVEQAMADHHAAVAAGTKSAEAGSKTPPVTPAALRTGKHITAQYLVDIAFTPESVSEAETTRLSVFFDAMAQTPEKELMSAIKGMPALAVAASKNKETAQRLAGQFRAMARVTIVQGSAAWATGLGLHKAHERATEILKGIKMLPSGKPRLDETERKAAARDAKVDALILCATKLAKADKVDMATIEPKAWAGYMQKAQAQIDTDWATAYVKSLSEDHTDAQMEALCTVLADYSVAKTLKMSDDDIEKAIAKAA